jgi:hypothetical protein
VTENVFDDNRHAIAASGNSGGYEAIRNLVLKGGGVHYRVPVFGWVFNTHQFDVHGDRSCYFRDANCGYAGVQFRIAANAFQYTDGNAIQLRGRPVVQAVIERNFFAHESASAAVALQTPVNVLIGPGNVADVDTFGTYGVCDFDGDAVDDLFLATGVSWWYSSFGEFHWTYMNDHSQRLDAVRFGYFDDDLRCDVLAEHGQEWFISSGGYGDWQLLGAFGAPLAEVRFGRFDSSDDPRPGGVTRRTTHAWWRTDEGRTKVKSLSAPSSEWLEVEGSSHPLSELQFGDFDGDGSTDVLGVVNGRWWTSKRGRDTWVRLNEHLGDPVAPLLIANMDADDNIDDILRVERRGFAFSRQLLWWRSKNGTDVWRIFKTLPGDYATTPYPPGFYFAGRFGAGPGGGIMAIDRQRVGWFYVPAAPPGGSTDFKSVFPY